MKSEKEIIEAALFAAGGAVDITRLSDLIDRPEDETSLIADGLIEQYRERESLIFSSIIDNDCHVHENCSLETGTVLGSRAVVSEGAILSGVRIWSDNVVERGGHLRSDVVD